MPDPEKSILEETLTPREIVAELDKYIIGQDEAKRSVAIALRNRARRQMLPEDMRDEVAPKNIIMIGPTGVGKTEIARRLARLANSPFIKVEASKYTEVGYVGRDVESMIRDLVDLAVGMVKAAHTEVVREKAEAVAEERLLDCLVPPLQDKREKGPPPGMGIVVDATGIGQEEAKIEITTDSDAEEQDAIAKLREQTRRIGILLDETSVSQEEFKGDTTDSADEEEDAIAKQRDQSEELRQQKRNKTRENFRQKLRDGKIEERIVEIEIQNRTMSFIEIFTPSGAFEEMDINLKEMFGGMFPKPTKTRKVTVAEARQILIQEEAEKLIDMDKVTTDAIARVENSGIVFLDELDKIAGRESSIGPDVSREGVQRDILPIVEGCSVMTKYGMVRTDHVLFIAAGAFHVSKPSDLIPELQGRFPIRVELSHLDADDFQRILTEPKNALVKQYIALLETEDIKVSFIDDAIEEIAQLAYKTNTEMGLEDIGARRLHTVMEKMFEDISFNAPELEEKNITIDAEYVRNQLADIVKSEDLRKYIL